MVKETMQSAYKYPNVVVKENSEYWAYRLDIPGVYGRGKTSKKAKTNIKQAIALYIDDCVADGDDIPAPFLN
jgi:predicted RNase H-like HicB family nuclease